MTVITTALIAGAAAGGTEAASMAVRDAYTALRDRLRGGADARTITVIEANEASPGSNIGELETALGERAVRDRELQEAAETMLTRLPSDRVDHARNRIVLSHAQGVQIGDHSTQVIYSCHGTWTDGVAPAPLIGVTGHVESPYRGLGWYSEHDAPFFFGRDTAIEEVLERLSQRVVQPGILMVSGVSGAGLQGRGAADEPHRSQSKQTEEDRDGTIELRVLLAFPPDNMQREGFSVIVSRAVVASGAEVSR
ncbi:hypothetical protein ACIG56_00235 [Nocardia fusca]|uniref:nSTAND1 domain-containing NTPase n=1 Tax=Nocardia fusca TaxID=941183 RepID=UPI0037CB3815